MTNPATCTEKKDFLLKQQAQRLFALQELPIELVEELARRTNGGGQNGSNGHSSDVRDGAATGGASLVTRQL